MKISIELNELEIRKILVNHLNNEFNLNINPESLPIQVKSKQNYKSEWEEANIRISTVINKPHK
jgi:hypothetical protein